VQDGGIKKVDKRDTAIVRTIKSLSGMDKKRGEVGAIDVTCDHQISV
jgi:hypothetical protein